MNRIQRNKNRETARQLSEYVFEATLPDGLTIKDGALHYECASCGNSREWYGTPDDFADPDAIKLCGGTQWCLP
jgi:hypothetical protein